MAFLEKETSLLERMLGDSWIGETGGWEASLTVVCDEGQNKI